MSKRSEIELSSHIVGKKKTRRQRNLENLRSQTSKYIN
jgi:hypothetical protein